MRMEQAIKDQVNFTTKRCLLAVVLAIFQFSQIALAQITVNHDTIIWPDDGWYEVQTYENQTTICEGGRSCVVGPGLYIVINHTTGERIDDFPVEYDPGEPILTELSQPTVIGSGPTMAGIRSRVPVAFRQSAKVETNVKSMMVFILSSITRVASVGRNFPFHLLQLSPNLTKILRR